MTRDDILRMARETGAGNLHGGEWALFGDANIERFFYMAYAAGAAAERKRIIKVCERYSDESDSDHESHGYAIAKLIEEMGQV